VSRQGIGVSEQKGCNGIFVDFVGATDIDNCLLECQGNSECAWFVYDPITLPLTADCVFYATCPEFTAPDCEKGCARGQRVCTDSGGGDDSDLGKGGKQRIKGLSHICTKQQILPADTEFLFVTGGNKKNGTTEIVDLVNPNAAVCEPVMDYLVNGSIYDAAGFLLGNGAQAICGGKVRHSTMGLHHWQYRDGGAEY
jgi:hypothetical protein